MAARPFVIAVCAFALFLVMRTPEVKEYNAHDYKVKDVSETNAWADTIGRRSDPNVTCTIDDIKAYYDVSYGRSVQTRTDKSTKILDQSLPGLPCTCMNIVGAEVLSTYYIMLNGTYADIPNISCAFCPDILAAKQKKRFNMYAICLDLILLPTITYAMYGVYRFFLWMQAALHAIALLVLKCWPFKSTPRWLVYYSHENELYILHCKEINTVVLIDKSSVDEPELMAALQH